MRNGVNTDAIRFYDRPTLLTVLCILTFIGSGLGLLVDILSLLGINFFSAKETITTIGRTLEFLGFLLCLLGAIRMWSLHKDGFWSYVVGAVFSILSIGPFIHNTIHGKTIPNGGFWIALVWIILINIAFVILYGVNKKHLVK